MSIAKEIRNLTDTIRSHEDDLSYGSIKTLTMIDNLTYDIDNSKLKEMYEDKIINIFLLLLPNETYTGIEKAYNEIINKIQELQDINVLYNKK